MHDQQLELLEAICRIDSRTAEGAAGTVEVAQRLGQCLQKLGFDLHWSAPLPHEGPRGQHLRAVRNPHAGNHILLVGHSDTILSPADAPYRVDRQAGRAYGSGVCDMKGGCVVLVEAIRLALKQASAVGDAGLTVLLNCCEETSSASFCTLARESAKGAAACMVFEPTFVDTGAEHRFVIGRKGVVRFKLTCTGRSAHAGNDHHIGVSAVRELARKIEQIESLTDDAKDLTANVGPIRGGHVHNQVPDHAAAEFELRAFDDDVLRQACEQVRRICSEPTVHSQADGTPARLALKEDALFPPWPCSSTTDELAQRYIEIARRHGMHASASKRGGGSDGSHVADLVPTLDGLGVWGGNMHSPDEWADLQSMPMRTQLAADLIASLCVNRL